jgi:hypothetical protein
LVLYLDVCRIHVYCLVSGRNGVDVSESRGGLRMRNLEN